MLELWCRIPSFVIRYIGVLKSRNRNIIVSQLLRHFIPYSPQYPVGYKIMELGLAPGPFVMSVSSIENPSVSLLPHPGPRLPVVTFYPLHQDRHVFVKMAVYVSFVPCFKFADSRHYRMVGIYNINCKIALSMGFELAPYGFHKPVRVPKAKGSAVDRYQGLAVFDVFFQRGFLLRGDLVMVGVNHQAVIFVERLFVQIVGIGSIGQVDPLLEQRQRQHRHQLFRIMVLAVVSQKKYLHSPWAIGQAGLGSSGSTACQDPA